MFSSFMIYTIRSTKLVRQVAEQALDKTKRSSMHKSGEFFSLFFTMKQKIIEKINNFNFLHEKLANEEIQFKIISSLPLKFINLSIS